MTTAAPQAQPVASMKDPRTRNQREPTWDPPSEEKAEPMPLPNTLAAASKKLDTSAEWQAWSPECTRKP